MHISILPILHITPALPQASLLELQKIAIYLSRGAFGARTGIHIGIKQTDNQATLMLEFPANSENHQPEIAQRVAITMLQMLHLSARSLGVSARLCGHPSQSSLRVDGLTYHFTRRSLAKMFAMQESQIPVVLACASVDFQLNIRFGMALGSASPLPHYICDTIIRRRFTRRGEVVRIRSGKQLMSIVIPNHMGSSAISEGKLISLTPIVGLVSRRVAQTEPCQMHLFPEQ